MTSVAVIIPLYNDALRVERAIQSTLNQKYLEEVIVVDDCSNDDSIRVVRALAEQDHRIRIFSLTQNSGPAVARNFGVEKAGSEFIAFLDSDDEYLPEYFSEVIPLMLEDSTLHACKVGMEFWDPVKGWILPAYDARYPAVVFSSSCNILMRRHTFLQMGGFSTDPLFREANGGEDVAFCQAVAQHLGPLRRIDKIFYRCWSQAGSHVDKFLQETRLAAVKDGFEFVRLNEQQKPGGSLEQAIAAYMKRVAERLAPG